MLKIDEFVSIKPKDEINYCIFVLPGRGQSGSVMSQNYESFSRLKQTLFVGMTPQNFAWYPMPFSAVDQEEAVEGLVAARETIDKYITTIQKRYSIPRNKIVILGFSAGGVMAIETAAHSTEPFAAVICHSGAILEPSLLPRAKHPDMPVLLTHNFDDDCFAWDERYLPMRDALVDNGYKTLTLEREFGRHRLSYCDIEAASYFIARKCFNQQFLWKEDEEKQIELFEECK